MTPLRFAFALLALALGRIAHAAEPVSFSRDVLPILSDRCFHCHGPDPANRMADLRLDLQDAAYEDRGGYAAIVPGKPEQSELLARVTSDDPDALMPPPDSHRKPLSADQIQTLTRWIADGAPWGRHWAFEKPTRPPVPGDAPHPIDAFVLHRLKSAGLSPANQAPPHTLIRRLSFDLTGLPPTPEEVAAFLNDESPDAYRNLVDRLLASKHYGERMAMWWLDAARYADTDGFQGDALRTNWPYRDWVIESFNRNQPFDEFTIEQFAGDLLPDATPQQILATCFHRNHMTNGEGGRDPEESRIDYVIDRVNTTGTVWLGLTLGCCQCHSHKFDPVSQTEYYQLFAFFNSIDENGKAGKAAKPYLKYKSPYVDRAVAEAQAVVDTRRPLEAQARRDAQIEFTTWIAQQLDAVQDGFEPWQPLRATELKSVEGTLLHQEADGTIQASGPHPRQDDYRLVASTHLPRVTGLRLDVFPHASHTGDKLSRGATGEFILTDVKLHVRKRGRSQLRDVEIASAVADVEREVKGRNYGRIQDTLDDDPRNGWTTEGHPADAPHTAVFALAEPLVLADDEELIFVLLHRSTEGDANIGRFRVAVTDQRGDAVRSLMPMPLEELAAARLEAPADIDPALGERLFDQFLADHAAYQRARESLDRAQRQLKQLKGFAGELDVMVLAERDEPRDTHLLERGVWDNPGEQVRPGVPAAVLPWPAEQTRSRLDLARWLVSPENPLTARVVVNHLWQMYFGNGLVRTPDDFGLQGERPTHPELLDWLAVELVEHDWDLQHVIRLIVTSQTYRQSSRVTDDLLHRDPENRLLARAGRFRLPSWMIRDAALRSSDLLNPALGGPPVMPYQPPGVWEEMFMGRYTYEPSQGAAQYRRTLYAFWRRSSSPTFLFDSAQRRVCEVQPRRTNTPLHALTLLNGVTHLEASRELARLALLAGETPEERFDEIYRRVLARTPTDRERTILHREYARALDHYRAAPSDTRRILAVGQYPVQAVAADSHDADPPELAALMVVAGMVLNLDEAITHE